MNESNSPALLRDTPGRTSARPASAGGGWCRALEPHGFRPPRVSRLATALPAGLLIAASRADPAGAKVADLVHDVGPGAANAQPSLTSLPASGRLLVASGWAPRSRDKRLLGASGDRRPGRPRAVRCRGTTGRARADRNCGLRPPTPSPTRRGRPPVSASPTPSRRALASSGQRRRNRRSPRGQGRRSGTAGLATSARGRAARPVGRHGTGDQRPYVNIAAARSSTVHRQAHPQSARPTPTEVAWSSDGARLLSAPPDAWWRTSAPAPLSLPDHVRGHRTGGRSRPRASSRTATVSPPWKPAGARRGREEERCPLRTSRASTTSPDRLFAGTGSPPAASGRRTGAGCSSAGPTPRPSRATAGCARFRTSPGSSTLARPASRPSRACWCCAR